MACPAPETAAALAPSVDTASVPDISEPPPAVDTGLAWSVYDPSQVPLRTWHETERLAVGVVLASVLIAGTVALTWPDGTRTAAAVVETSEPVAEQMPQVSVPAPPAEVRAPPVPTLPASPGRAEYLQEPLSNDEVFLARMRAAGWVITNRPQLLAVAHQACADVSNGASREYVISKLYTTDPSVGADGAVSFYYNMIAAYGCASG
ncbi:hypothetical protein NJB1604_45340 [Mycobacterium marinum]|nr:hypothetical protein NJB1604_45340 [Mycobacterium marinum]